MEYINKMNLKFCSISENEGFARLAVASFCSLVIKDLETITDIKTAVSEAVTNSIVHGYNNQNVGYVEVECELQENQITIRIIDNGVGIGDIDEARKPFFTSKPELERSGMGFTVMEGFMDKVDIESIKDKGTKVTLIKYITK